MTSMPAGGLGRGLSSILSGTPAPVRAVSALRPMLVAAALDELCGAASLSICAVLDGPTGRGDLTVELPDLTHLHPTEGHRLQERFALAAREGAAPTEREGDDVLCAISAPGSALTWFVAGPDLDTESMARLRGIAERHGVVLDQSRRPAAAPELAVLDGLLDANRRRPTPVTEPDGGTTVRARRELPRPIRTAGPGPDPTLDDRAAVDAVLDAAGSDATLVSVDRRLADDGDIVVVRLSTTTSATPEESDVVGAAPVRDDVHPAAIATLRALRR